MLALGVLIASTTFAQDEPDDEKKKPKSPIQQEIQKLREQQKKIRKEIEKLKTKQALTKAFEKKVKRLSEKHKLSPKQAARLQLAAKGAIARTLPSVGKLRWEDDVPKWAQRYRDYVYRWEEQKYFGADPEMHFAVNQEIWRKTIESTLPKAALEKRKATYAERRAFTTKTHISTLIVDIDSSVRLTKEQRESMSKLIEQQIQKLGFHVELNMLDRFAQIAASTIPDEAASKILNPDMLAKWKDAVRPRGGGGGGFF